MDYPASLPDVYLHLGKFTDGTPDGVVPPSRDPADWANAVTDEILAVITAAGLVPAEGDNNQMVDAIAALIAAAVGSLSVKQRTLVVTAVTFAAGVVDGNPVRWDAGAGNWAKALADSSANDLGLGIADVTNAEVTLYGETRAGLMAGLTPGARYYLAADGSLATSMVSDAIAVGVAKSATVLWVDFDPVPGRRRLTSDITFYVSAAGSDANSGMSAGQPFATPQKAWDVLQAGFDLNGHIATIQVADGTYTNLGIAASGPIVGAAGAGGVIVNCNAVTPSAVIFNRTDGGTIFYATSGAAYTVTGLKMQGTNCVGIYADSGGEIAFSTVDFGAMGTGTHIKINLRGSVTNTGNYTISGGAWAHLYNYGWSSIGYVTVTLTGVPAFTYYTNTGPLAYSYVAACTFVGTATGARYLLQPGGLIYTNGAGTSYLPGNAAGTIQTGGNYV